MTPVTVAGWLLLLDIFFWRTAALCCSERLCLVSLAGLDMIDQMSIENLAYVLLWPVVLQSVHPPCIPPFASLNHWCFFLRSILS